MESSLQDASTAFATAAAAAAQVGIQQQQQQQQQQSSANNISHRSTSRTNNTRRSVVDYESKADLRKALLLHHDDDSSSSSSDNSVTIISSDWLLPVPDDQAEVQTVETELERLWTLKSYLLLDAEREEAFDKLTREACELFRVPVSLISLVDLGRQFLWAGYNDNDDDDDNENETSSRETPRSVAFCSHTILSKTGICVVPDTTVDERFRYNALVTGGPKLRFYAGAPLISPEGYKLGTFCVEGPEPRPQGLTDMEVQKLKELAATAMRLMVERRAQYWQTAAVKANWPQHELLRHHAATATNLGTALYKYSSTYCVLAMRLFQESVQTLMHVEEDDNNNNNSNNSSGGSGGGDNTMQFASAERQEKMAQLLQQMNDAVVNETGDDGDDGTVIASTATTATNCDTIIEQIQSLFPESTTTTAATAAAAAPINKAPPEHYHGPTAYIPGLFSTHSSKLLSSYHHHRNNASTSSYARLQGLIFNEAFEISMEPSDGAHQVPSDLDDRSFIIPLEQSSKATLFNMGLIHYHWGSADSAMQFFDLAASLSQHHDATHFDPVILGCLNNMAQINLQYGRVGDAMELLSDALTRGNAALTTIYGSNYSGGDTDSMTSAGSSSQAGGGGDYVSASAAKQEADIRRTRRLRRKLSRTVLHTGHVHFFKCDYESAMRTCHDALMLLHTNMDEVEVAAIWYNMALLQYHTGHKLEALKQLDKFLELARTALPPCHLQLAEGLLRKGKILFEMGNLYDCMPPLNQALSMRRTLLGENSHPAVAEALCLIGKVLQEREEYDFALNALEQGLIVQRASLAAVGGEEQMLSFEVAQTLLEIGRAHHAQNDLEKSLPVYLEVARLTRKVFGEQHAFVARVNNIIGNLYLESGKTDESMKYFAEAMRIQRELKMTVNMTIVQDPLLKVNLQPHPCASGA